MKKEKQTGKIRMARLKWLATKKLTIKSFAAKTGVAEDTVRRWFAGDRSPRSLFLGAVLRVFGDWPY